MESGRKMWSRMAAILLPRMMCYVTGTSTTHSNKKPTEMCTNDAVNRLECYMDDLVDCFEDFVKKSLIIMSVAVGAILILLSYLLKLLLDRSSSRSLRVSRSEEEDDRQRSRRPSWSSSDSRYLKDTSSDSSLLRKKTSSTTVLVDKKTMDTPVQMSAMPSMDERFLKQIGYSNCSKSCSANKRNLVRNCSTSRIMVPSMPTCMPKHHLAQPRMCSKMAPSRKSCCSMCCADDDSR